MGGRRASTHQLRDRAGRRGRGRRGRLPEVSGDRQVAVPPDRALGPLAALAIRTAGARHRRRRRGALAVAARPVDGEAGERGDGAEEVVVPRGDVELVEDLARELEAEQPPHVQRQRRDLPWHARVTLGRS